ncbi:2-hydroxy-3-oxopropionate reductase [Comamonas serinivorans]|uniref:2-hydroxy-3-oxopropionate reductase n=1 Tax=Comamonas serinivorans TaxID=1082851 RepID=A0A1Y0EQC1_9BURK|nr:NAD(P)-dependent oxidoreductase [Comamonas serinivorans]ARU05854.1 2-hydroxy-3-oxopropionate reductase [Comamonas serinivorans]
MMGIGLMGHGIARNLLRHGHALTLLAHPGNQPVEDLIAAGARCAHTPAEVARGAEVVLLCVTGSPQVEAVLLGDQGAVAALAPGAVVIDCSTAMPESTRRMADAVAAVGAHFIDAAMTRTPREAAEGRLNLLVGGDAATVARCMPLLRCFAETITATGAVGSGHAMKLLHNYVSLGSLALLAEAAACAGQAGVDTRVLLDVLQQGGAAGVPLDRMRPYLIDGDTDGLRFAIANAAKDLAYYTRMASEGDAWHRIADAVSQTLAQAVASGAGARMMPELSDVLTRLK